MFKYISILVVMTLSLSLVSGFMLSQSSSLSRSKMTRYATTSDADDDDWKKIIGSEYNIEEYLGQDGWRYRMAKTEDEINEEGDYTFFQRMFGATSNNKVRLAAREDARQNYQVDSDKQALNNEWVMKYGYKRFYPSYLDKAALSDAEAESMKKKPVVATPAKAKEVKEDKPKFSMPSMPSFGSFGQSSSKSSAPNTASTSKATSSRPTAVKTSAPKATPVVESAPAKTKPIPSPKKMTFTVSTFGKGKDQGGNLNLMKSPKKN